MVNKPMLADNKDWNPAVVETNLPLLGFIKLDGIRMLSDNGVGYSRSLKPLPNRDLQAKVMHLANALQGMDGEIIVGEPDDELCFKKSHRSCMKADLISDHKYWVFDLWDQPADMPYVERYQILRDRVDSIDPDGEFLILVPYTELGTMPHLEQHFDAMIRDGHEGSIYRRPDGPYKNGRSTTKSGWMYKRKSRVDTEVTIVGFNELMINNNPPEENELGRTSRSTHQENLEPGDTLGSVDVTGFFEDGRPFQCNIGVFKGYSKAELKEIWDNQEEYRNTPLKIKYMGIGSDQAPRIPVALSFRDPMDMS